MHAKIKKTHADDGRRDSAPRHAVARILLWCRLDVLFIPLCFFTMLTLGLVGFYDDYIKLTHAKSDGLSKREKLFFQFIVGGGVGLCLDVVMAAIRRFLRNLSSLSLTRQSGPCSEFSTCCGRLS